jgi:hypothetical protein
VTCWVAETLDLLKNAAAKSKQAISGERIESPTTEPSRPAIALPNSDRSELKARLARFKATQTKFQQEREEYYSETMAKARATQWRADTISRSR